MLTKIPRVPVKCETKSKRNETKRNQSKRNETNRNETKPKSKPNETKIQNQNEIKDLRMSTTSSRNV